MRRVTALFAAVPFLVIAPSRLALDLWQRATGLTHCPAHIHPHARLEPPATPSAAPEREADDAGPARVAFVGHAVFHKGWDVFAALVAATHAEGSYQFFHFASRAELRGLDGVTQIVAETTAAKPFGMAHALAEHRIDLLLALSPWPETFGYVAHEALAAGADIVALEGGGNITDLVRRRACGVVVADGPALMALFASGRAAEHVRRQRAGQRQRSTLVHSGSTATLALTPGQAMTTDDPDLHIVLRGARLDGTRVGERWRFTLPEPPRAGANALPRLCSRHVRGAWEDIWGGDARRLGVAVTAIALDGGAIPRGDRRLGAGWHKPEAAWQWTDGNALVQAGAGRVLEVSVRPLARYWCAPLLARDADPTQP